MEERVTTAGIAIRQGQVLVARREKGGALSGKWEFPGGKQRWGESDSDTLRREYMEELGLEIEVGELIGTTDFVNHDTLYHLHAHLITIKDGEMHLTVHTALQWVDGETLLSLDMGPSDSEIRNIVAPLLLKSDLLSSTIS